MVWDIDNEQTKSNSLSNPVLNLHACDTYEPSDQIILTKVKKILTSRNYNHPSFWLP